MIFTEFLDVEMDGPNADEIKDLKNQVNTETLLTIPYIKYYTIDFLISI